VNAIPTAATLRTRPPGLTLVQHLDEVRDALARHTAESVRLTDEAEAKKAQRESGSWLASERRAVDKHSDEAHALELLLRELENSPEARKVDYSQVADTWSAAVGSGQRAQYRSGQPLTAEQSMSGYVRAAGDVPEDQPELSLQRYIRGLVTGEWRDADSERRAMAEGVLATGGYLVPTQLSAQIIDLARAQTRVLQAGARLVPMATKRVDIAKWVGDPTAAWHTEAAVIAPSDAAIGKVELDAKALAGLTVVSRELIEDAAEVDARLREAFAAQFALTVDRAALYGSGTAPEPRGVRNTSGVTLLSMGANGAAPANHDFLIDAVAALADDNEVATAAIYSPRTGKTIGKFKDSTGQPLQVPPYLTDLRRYETKQVPDTLTQGTANNTSDVFVANWAQLMVGVRTTLQIQVLTERYADTGQLGFLCWWRGDVAVARPQAFAVTTGLLP